MIKKIVDMIWKVIGMPYNIIKRLIMYLYVQVIRLFINGWKLLKGLVSALKWALLELGFGFSYLLNLNYKKIGKWLIDVFKESIAQIFTLLGFFIAWFTLTGTAQDIVGIAIVISTVIWLLTIRLRD